MRLLYRIEMPPSNRLRGHDNEDHEHGPGAFNINREAHLRSTALRCIVDHASRAPRSGRQPKVL
jgi:hypothetical protein